MAVENFRLVTPIERVFKKDLTLADPTLANPNAANPLLDGEWLEYDSSYKGVRAGGNILTWALWAERGRTDVQGLRKVPVIYMGGYEADTLIMDSTSIALGDKLMVDDVTISSLTKSGLKKHGGGSELIIGYVTRIPSSNGQKLRFMQILV
jgi:hypothetical protein